MKRILSILLILFSLSTVLAQTRSVVMTQATAPTGSCPVSALPRVIIVDSGTDKGKEYSCVNGTWGLIPAKRVYTDCWTLIDRTSILATDDIPSFWGAPAAVTITGFWCESDASNGVVMNLAYDSSCDTAAISTTYIMSSDVTCTTTRTNGTVNQNQNIPATGCLDMYIASIGTTPKRLNFCVEYTYD